MSIISTVPKGAAVEGINPNLLRNWYFVGGGTGRGVFPVNSRGFTTSSNVNGVWSIDGWYINGGRGTQTLQSTGFYINNNSGSGNLTVQQWIGSYQNQYAGKTMTLSVLVNNHLFSASGIIPQHTTTTQAVIDLSLSGIYCRFYVVVDETYLVQFIAGAAKTALIQAVKLELGNRQTLCHQENGVWVLNEIPDYEEEYYRCITDDSLSTDTYANQKVSNITVQCNSVGSSSLRYYNKLIQSTHKVLDSTFSNPAAQTSNITVTTYDGYLDFSNGFASGATTNITLVLGTSGPVLSTTTTAPS